MDKKIDTHQGYRKRYGFIYVDQEEFDLKELKRFRKDSFTVCKLILENGQNL